jgi:hypothetical protein
LAVWFDAASVKKQTVDELHIRLASGLASGGNCQLLTRELKC